MAGVRLDAGEGPARTWAALGVQGLAPYKFEVDATLYLGTSGRSMATAGAEYETLFTGRLILQWQLEATWHGGDDLQRGVSSGLSSVEAGARLRYEVTRGFAPYVGLQSHRAFGGTADLRSAAGEPVSETRVVAGVRVAF
jgi:copper resistance protein B